MPQTEKNSMTKVYAWDTGYDETEVSANKYVTRIEWSRKYSTWDTENAKDGYKLWWVFLLYLVYRKWIELYGIHAMHECYCPYFIHVEGNLIHLLVFIMAVNWLTLKCCRWHDDIRTFSNSGENIFIKASECGFAISMLPFISPHLTRVPHPMN